MSAIGSFLATDTTTVVVGNLRLENTTETICLASTVCTILAYDARLIHRVDRLEVRR